MTKKSEKNYHSCRCTFVNALLSFKSGPLPGIQISSSFISQQICGRLIFIQRLFHG